MDLKKLDELIDGFVDYILVSRDLAKSTASAYTHDVKTYIRFIEDEINCPLGSFQIEENLIYKYLSFLKERGLKGTTIERRLVGLLKFWSYLYRSGLSGPPVSLDDMDIKVKTPRNPEKPLGDVDYQRMTEDLDYVFVCAEKFFPFAG